MLHIHQDFRNAKAEDIRDSAEMKTNYSHQL